MIPANGGMSNGYTNGHHAESPTSSSGGINYDKLKQELVAEFRKELQSFKADIISGKSLGKEIWIIYQKNKN